MLNNEETHKPEFAYDVVRINYLMKNTDVIDFNTVGDTKVFQLRCLAFVPKLRAEKIVGTGKNLNYQTIRSLGTFKTDPQGNCSRKTWLKLRNTSSGKRLFLSFRNLRFVLMFRKTSNVLLVTRRHFDWIASRHLENPLFEVDKLKLEETSLSLCNLMGASKVAFLRDYVDPVGKRLLGISWSLLLRKLQKLEVLGNFPGSSNECAKSVQKTVGFAICNCFPRKVFLRNPQNIPVGRNGIFLCNILTNHLKFFGYQTLEAFCGNVGGKVPVADDLSPSRQLQT